MTTQETRAAPAPRLLEGVERAVRVLQALDGGSTLTLAEVAHSTGLTEPTAQRYLTTLATHGLVERAASGGYRLGWEMFRLGQLAVASQFPRQVVLPIMQELRDHFGETVNFALRESYDLVIVATLEGSRMVRQVARPGQREPWHASALGKAMLAHMPPEDRRTLLEHTGCQRLTPCTIVDDDQLERELEAVHTRGYAVDMQESDDDLICVGAAVMPLAATPAYALSISFLAHRLASPAALETAGEAVRAAADELSARLWPGRGRGA